MQIDRLKMQIMRKNKRFPFKKKDYFILSAIAVGAVLFSIIASGFAQVSIYYMFRRRYFYLDGEWYWYYKKSLIFYTWVNHLFGVALIEEFAKHILLFLQLKTKKVRTYLDCITSFLFVGVLFAVIEDIKYYVNYDVTYRFIGALSGHLMFSMIVGGFYYRYMVNKKIVILDRFLKDVGAVDSSVRVKGCSKIILAGGFLLAVALHTLYNFLASLYPVLWIICLVLYGVIFIILYIGALKNKLILSKAIERYEKLQSQVNKKQIFELITQNIETKKTII